MPEVAIGIRFNDYETIGKNSQFKLRRELVDGYGLILR